MSRRPTNNDTQPPLRHAHDSTTCPVCLGAGSSSSAAETSNEGRKPRKTRPDNIVELLPVELLASICDYLAVDDINSVRETCRGFHKGAHTNFGRTVDERTFSITCNEIALLERHLQNTGCGPYLRTLRIDTAVTCNCQRDTYLRWAESNDQTVLTMGVFRGFERKQTAVSNCGQALKRVIRTLKHLKRIELCQRVGTDRYKLSKIGGFMSVSSSDVNEGLEPYLSVERWASWRALDLLVRAFDQSVLERSLTLSKPTKVLLKGPFPVESLPTPSLPTISSRLFSHASSVKLRLADIVTYNFGQSVKKLDGFLPEFLRALPVILEGLTLEFPKDPDYAYHVIAGQTPSYNMLFAERSVEGLLRNQIYFPLLRKLHLSNVSTHRAGSLQSWLATHSTTIRVLAFTSLALAIKDWRPFLQFLGSQMKLQKFKMKSNLSVEERNIQDSIWELTPMHQRPNSKDYRGIAKEATLNGQDLNKVAKIRKKVPSVHETEDEDEDGAEDEVGDEPE